MGIKAFLKKQLFFVHKFGNFLFVKHAFFKHRKSVLLWIYPHIGDLFYALPYVNDYKVMSHAHIVLIGNERYQSLYKLFPGIDAFCMLPEKKVWSFICTYNFKFMQRYLKKKVAEGKFVTNDVHLMAEIFPIDPNISLQEYTKRYIYRLPEESAPYYPSLRQSSRLSDHKYVIISPYAQTVKTADLGCFEYLASLLVQRGYEVFTNTHGSEEPLRGTKRLDCGLLELCEHAAGAAAFVSLRSGISDMIAAMTKTECFFLFNGYAPGKFATTVDYRVNGQGIHEYYDLVDKPTMDKILEAISHKE